MLEQTLKDASADAVETSSASSTAARGARELLATTLAQDDRATGFATVVVADDHPLFVEAVRFALSRHRIDVVGCTGRGDEVVSLIECLEPDVLLLDLAMPGMDGLDCLKQLAERRPAMKVIVLSADDRPEIVERALELGALCFVGKSVEADDLARVILLVSDGSPVVISRGIRAGTPARPTPARVAPLEPATTLTKREREILALVAEGRTNSEVARTLWVTEQTVKFHLSNIYRKLDVQNRTQAAAKARHLGISELPLSA
jgi:DNA-binding NarL/FixJ family response regulator